MLKVISMTNKRTLNYIESSQFKRKRTLQKSPSDNILENIKILAREISDINNTDKLALLTHEINTKPKEKPKITVLQQLLHEALVAAESITNPTQMTTLRNKVLFTVHQLGLYYHLI